MTTTEPALSDVADFIDSHFYGLFKGAEAALEWLHWFVSQDLVFIAADNDGVSGVLAVRPVTSIPAKDDFYTIDPGGSILWLEMFALKDDGECRAMVFPERLRFLWGFLRTRFNLQQFKQVGYRLRKHADRLVIRDFMPFNAHIEG